uniref:Uncharacterized protein n=1 Tax=Physcomitrium patens TaxID=3218 RepID=A0A2K1K6X4_PHYPA|nr:hypothetical protein PHYPA_011413 [Physcomitrium patens]
MDLGRLLDSSLLKGSSPVLLYLTSTNQFQCCNTGNSQESGDN